jgi:SMI1 / KNR4 family (SUKH-1)
LTARFPDWLEVIERARAFGYRETKQGVRLYGSVPHVAPHAWFHAIPPGLSGQQISELGRDLLVTLPAAYVDFLRVTNGAHLFSTALSLLGVRPAAAGRDIDSAFLPFNIINSNGAEKPIGLRDAIIVIGFYKFDGSHAVLDTSTGRVQRIGRDGVARKSWSSFAEFRSSEVLRLDALHDSEGKLVAAREMLVPFDFPARG